MPVKPAKPTGIMIHPANCKKEAKLAKEIVETLAFPMLMTIGRFGDGSHLSPAGKFTGGGKKESRLIQNASDNDSWQDSAFLQLSERVDLVSLVTVTAPSTWNTMVLNTRIDTI